MGKTDWINIVAGILGRAGGTRENAADACCQVPRKNEANNQKKYFQKRPYSQSIVRMLYFINVDGTVYRNNIMERRTRGCRCFCVTSETVRGMEDEKV